MHPEQTHFRGPVLFYASLYPGTWNPVHGLFVYELRRALSRLCAVPAIVPENGWRRLFASQPPFSFAAEGEQDVLRPTFWSIPKIGSRWAGRMMAACTRRSFRWSLSCNPVLVHAHYAYPEAEAAATLADEAGLPLVVTVHGSDINMLASCPVRGERIVRTLLKADAVVGVSRALCEKVRSLGIDQTKVFHIPNGVDLNCFRPQAAETDTLADSIDSLVRGKRVILAVGRLEPVKGFDKLLKAVAMLDQDCALVIAGEGSQLDRLQEQAELLDMRGRVHFLGAISREELAAWYRKAMVLAVSSHSEGWPTIIYEALACETPVVAPAVGGIREILHSPSLGVLLSDNAPRTLAQGLRDALATRWDGAQLYAEAERNSWDAIAAMYVEIYRKVA
ncbi:glycosyltransferase [Desulfovibrio mangrovi]|uniref:glycosyltransferase n=1 Tax=Desulfovibrio mangrovi TaxID=2976983 RepID=UPI002245D19F|nr:glycosyltransferase [Desulfovibrio mangrovi]UZP69209.1 glycosyltransferase [Desulfovibrio mangrovi]